MDINKERMEYENTIKSLARKDGVYGDYETSAHHVQTKIAFKILEAIKYNAGCGSVNPVSLYEGVKLDTQEHSVLCWLIHSANNSRVSDFITVLNYYRK